MTNLQVIHNGSKENAFQVNATMPSDEVAGYSSNIYALTMNKHDNSPKKPFVCPFEG